jgi:hypothetical protein
MHASGSPRPLGPLILLIVGVLLALAIFWIGFMLAPAAVLLISYLALSAGEKADRKRRAESSQHEPAIELGASRTPQSSTGPSTASRTPTQFGARRMSESSIQPQAQAPADSELVQAGSVSSQPRGART